ncbi:beta-1,3-galactosyltransferase 5-like [Agrilus planipennis]|uniref:Hexosyltransferase n=1 Tax=Agrilus planipennis TaxID=224129 RepID=A0A1W4WYY7_AGRPL|nr:beta-1,3-galactosyltransferase 5-like [Agrilus planipennis]
MKEWRWPNIAFVIFGFFVCLSVWHVINDPTSITVLHQYDIIPVYTLNTENFTKLNYPLETLPPLDYRKLITIREFRYNIFNNVCNNSIPFLLILVHSAPENVVKRMTIRETWGQNTKDVKVVFLIGNVSLDKIQSQLETENEQYRDLIQGNFLDAYRNMTFKHVMALKYAIYHCPKAKYILKTDDDIFVNIPTLLTFLKEELSPYGAENLLLCALLLESSRVKRTYRSKWRVSFKEYSGRYYPPYCSGYAIMYSPDVVFTLYKEAQKAQYFWIDDAYITGLLAQKAKISHTSVENLVLNKEEMREVLKTGNCHNCSKNFLFGQPDLTRDEILKMWKFIMQQQNISSSIGGTRMTR